MKSWIGRSVLPLAFVLVALATPTYAQSNEESDERGCSNAMLSGNYAFTIGGQILLILASVTPPATGVAFAQAGVAMMHFDGTGHFTQVDFTMINGAPSPGATNENGFRDGAMGTYTVNPDCTGSAEIDFPPPPVFSLMTSFTHCPGTSFTLLRSRSERGGVGDGVEGDGSTRTAGEVCGGGVSAG